jgi:hypothetical protein
MQDRVNLEVRRIEAVIVSLPVARFSGQEAVESSIHNRLCKSLPLHLYLLDDFNPEAIATTFGGSFHNGFGEKVTI